MISYCLLAVLVATIGVNADSPKTPCSKQIELEMRCLLTVETSPEATMVRDRMKSAKKTCAPNYPAECHAQFEAGHQCAVSVAKNADSDPLFTESKAKTQPAVDQCFETFPPDVKKGVMEIFSFMKPPGNKHHRKQWKHRGNDTSNASGENASGENASGENASGENGSGENASSENASGESASNETSSFERKHRGGGGRGGGGRGGGGRGGHGGRGGGGRGGGGRGGGGRGGRGRHGKGCRPHRRHHKPGNFSSDDRSNSSESASASKEHMGGASGGASGEKRGGRHGKLRDPKCEKTPEQHKCIKDEMQKLAKDTAFIDVINTLLRQKKKCKQIVDWSCSTKCPKRKKCVFKATKPCRNLFMTSMKTCMQEKGFTLPPMSHGDKGTTFSTPLPVLQN